MLHVKASQLLDQVYVEVRCYHGWRDRDGHKVVGELCAVDGEDFEQLAVCIQDVLNHALKDRSRVNCTYDLKNTSQDGPYLVK